MDYFSGFGSKGIYTIQRKSIGVKLLNYVSCKDKSITCYQMKSIAPCTSKVKSDMIKEEDVYFSKKDDYNEYAEVKIRAKHPIKLLETESEPGYARRRKAYMKYEEPIQIRPKILYESPSFQPTTYTMHTLSPSTNLVLSKLTSKPKYPIKPHNSISNFTSMWVEIYCCINHNRPYNPLIDQISAIFIVIDKANKKRHEIIEVETSMSEKELLQEFIELLNIINPDVIIGYDNQRSSIGFIAKRLELIGNTDLNIKYKTIDLMKYLYKFTYVDYVIIMKELFEEVVPVYNTVQLKKWYIGCNTKCNVYEYFFNRITNYYVLFIYILIEDY